jgi:hypothetical protein
MCYRSIATLSAVLAIILASDKTRATNVYYDFEGDSGDFVMDKLASDGAQNGELLGNVSFDTFLVPWGTQSLFFDTPTPLPTAPPWSTLEIPDSTLGSDYSLTLAGFFDNKKDPGIARQVVRLFSSFRGTGTQAGRVIFDYDRSGAVGFAYRTNVSGTITSLVSPVPAGMANPGYHHYAVTIGGGNAQLYFDGTIPIRSIFGLVKIHMTGEALPKSSSSATSMRC